MDLTIKGEPKEIAALVLEIQGRHWGRLVVDDPDADAATSLNNDSSIICNT